MSARKDNKLAKCIKCNKATNKLPKANQRLIETDDQAAELSQILEKTVSINDFICIQCYASITFAISKQRKLSKEQNKPQTSSETDSQESTPLASQSSEGSIVEFIDSTKPDLECVELPFARSIATHKYCFLCGKSSNIILVPFNARKDVFIRKRIFIPNGNRCCANHLIKNRFYDDELNNIRIVSHSSSVEITEVTKLLDTLSLDVDKELLGMVGDFTLSEERLKILTSLNWEDLIKLRTMLTSMRNSNTRTVNQALVTFLFKLRSGNSNNVVFAVLGLDRPQQVSDFSASILRSFEEDVLPTRFGIKAMSRDYLIKNGTSPIAKKLHDIKDNQLALIADGSYLRHQKSTNNEYQKKSYSGQKKLPLCKPFTICTTNGFVPDVLGPFNAILNDAQIMEMILDEPDGLSSLLKPNDIFIVDRGFRDVVKYLEDRKYKVLMPSLKGTKNQLTTAEANHSRLVTMVRWPVEAVHGVIGQKFKLLHNQFDNKLLPNAALYCKVACFLQNEFGKRFISRVQDDEVIAQVKSQKDKENTLYSEVSEGKWSRRSVPFQKLLSKDVMDFPEMTEKDLELLFTGTYQLQLAISYLAEMMDSDGEINLQYLKASRDIIKVQVRSRHIKAKTYNCFIQYKADSIGVGGILRYYCECANGMRTIGCCAHVAAIIYFLSHARFLSKIVRPAETLSNIFDSVHSMPVINDDSDEDD